MRLNAFGEVENVVPLRSWALWDKRIGSYGRFGLFGAVGRAVTSLAVLLSICGETGGCGRLMTIGEASLWSPDSDGPLTL